MSARRPPDRARVEAKRHLLVAVEESDDSRRAVMYVADFFGGYPDIFVTLLSILADPPEDLFANDQARLQWVQEQKRSRQEMLDEFRRILVGGGLSQGRITTRLIVRRYASLGDAILEEQEKLQCCIVVLGRRGLSRHEEFLFGSTTSRILHRAKHCAILVVE